MNIFSVLMINNVINFIYPTMVGLINLWLFGALMSATYLKFFITFILGGGSV